MAVTVLFIAVAVFVQTVWIVRRLHDMTDQVSEMSAHYSGGN